MATVVERLSRVWCFLFGHDWKLSSRGAPVVDPFVVCRTCGKWAKMCSTERSSSVAAAVERMMRALCFVFGHQWRIDRRGLPVVLPFVVCARCRRWEKR